MEKAAAGAGAGSCREVALGAVLALVSWLCPVVHAQDAAPKPPTEVLVAQARVDQPMRMQVQSSSLPRFDSQDSGFQAPRVDLSITPFDRSGNGLGAVFGLATPSTAPGLQARPGVDLGLRWSQKLQSQRVDITAWRRMNVPDDAYTQVLMHEPVYGARVEMNLSAAQRSGLAMDLGFVGFQMESGARITIKRKDGRPMLYYRSAF
jgi:hypothetical protein